LKDGARSSLPQYRQTSISVLDAAGDDRGGCCGAVVVFVARAAFDAAPPAFFFAAAADLPLGLTNTPGVDSVSVFK
jgi:hypothetical protein